MNYHQQMKHPLWQKKRLEVLELHSFECQDCGSKEEELHVHHPYYRKGAMIWDYEAGELECLCHKCHSEAHALDERIKKALALCPDKNRILGYIEASAGDISLNANTYEYCTGVGDWLAYGELTNKERNLRHDAIEMMMSENKGLDGLQIRDLYSPSEHNI